MGGNLNLATRERMRNIDKGDMLRQLARYKEECSEVTITYVNPEELKKNNRPIRSEWEIYNYERNRNKI